jgi:murein L,D-transpeptidase YafK
MRLIVVCFFIATGLFVNAQPPKQRDFLSFQKSFKTVSDAFLNKEDSLKAQFEAKGLVWPAKFVYIRSFKYDSQLEVWVKDKKKDPYKLFKKYKVCALAGNLGPKRFEGDYQVPEGFYYFNEFKAKSNYHLALGINYPNASDRKLSDSIRPGGDVYVHGSCVTVGCIPLTDSPIEELYVLTANTRNAGQDFIPIHVFPVRFKKPKNQDKMAKFLELRPDYEPMVNSMMSVYYYFEQKKQLPTILINSKGDYFIAEDFHYTIPKYVEHKFVENAVPRIKPTKVANLTDKDFFPSVYKVAAFPGGNAAFQVFVEKLQAELSEYLLPAKKRIFVQVDFVIDKDGNLVNVNVGNNANNEMNNLIIKRFEDLPKWSPAIRQEAVAIKLQQSLMIEAKPVAAAAAVEEDD